MRLVLHIGMPRTGSSSIQDFCGDNETALRKEGVLFARAGRILSFKDKRRHMGFSFACHPPDAAPTHLMRLHGLTGATARKRYAKRFWRRFDREIAGQDGIHTVVLSEEGLSFTPYIGLPQQAHDMLGQRFAEVQVMCMLREPFALLSSSYVQAVKIGTAETWDAYRDRMLDEGLYFTRIRPWLDIFGPNQMKIRVLQQDALASFASVVGFRLPHGSARATNISMSSLGVEQLRALNATYQKEGRKRPPAVRSSFARYMKGPSWRAPAQDAVVIYDRLGAEMTQLVTSGLLTDEDNAYVAAQWTPEAAVKKIPPHADIYKDGADGMTALLRSLFR